MPSHFVLFSHFHRFFSSPYELCKPAQDEWLLDEKNLTADSSSGAMLIERGSEALLFTL